MSKGMTEELDEWFLKTAKYISIRPRSEKELRDYVNKKKVPASIIKPLFEKLHSLKFLDDEKFVSWWIDQRNTFRPRSVIQLRSELNQKGISRDIIDTALAKYITTPTEIDAAKRLVKKKLKLISKIENREKKLKLTQFLLRKGFPWEIIEKAIQESI